MNGIGEPSPVSPEAEWDMFISHASEDKEAVVRPLAAELRGRGVRVWYDEYELKIGDSLRGKIDYGLARSRAGVLVISPAFFTKHWTKEELSGLTALEVAAGRNRLLPVWHNVSQKDVAANAPMLADRFAGTTAQAIPELAVQLIDALEVGPPEDRFPPVALSIELGEVADPTVRLQVRNVGPIHAMHVALEPREVAGRGVPLTPNGSDSILAGQVWTAELERFPPQDGEAHALYDLLYSDPAARVVKRQRLRFYLAHDVVTLREYSHLAMERDGPEDTFSDATLEPGLNRPETSLRRGYSGRSGCSPARLLIYARCARCAPCARLRPNLKR